MVSYHHVQYHKKLMTGRQADGWTDRHTDGQTDIQTEKSGDFIGRCPTNVERPKGVKYVKVNKFTVKTPKRSQCRCSGVSSLFHSQKVFHVNVFHTFCECFYWSL